MRPAIIAAFAIAAALTGCQRPTANDEARDAAIVAERDAMQAKIADLEKRTVTLETVTKLTAARVSSIGQPQPAAQRSPTEEMLDGLRADNTERRLRAVEEAPH